MTTIRGDASTRVPGFVSKAFEIFSDGQHGDICGWGREGKTVVVRRITEFENTVRARTWLLFNFLRLRVQASPRRGVVCRRNLCRERC